MKKRIKLSAVSAANVVFQPALAPLEASVLPAATRRRGGALRQAREAFRLASEPVAPARFTGRRSGSDR